MEGEWGPTDKGSSVVAAPPKLHIANLGSGSCNEKIFDPSKTLQCRNKAKNNL